MVARFLVSLLVAVGLAAVPGCWPAGSQGGMGGQGPAAAKVPLVDVGQPVLATVTDYEEFPGRTEGYQFVEVRPRVSGLLLRQLFKDGDEVDTREPLFKIDPEPFEAEVQRAQASVEQAIAHRQRLSYDYGRAESNFRKNAISREEFDKFKGDLDEGIAAVGISEAVLKTAELNLKWTDVTAFPEELNSDSDEGNQYTRPRMMRASKRMVDPGNMVQANTTALTTLIDLSKLYIAFDIDEPTVLKIRQEIKAGKLKTRDQAPVKIIASPANDESLQIETQLDFTDNTLVANSGTLSVRGTISNEPIPGTRLYMLSPGMQMKVRLRIGEPHPAYLVAEQAINNDLERKFIYVLDDLRDANGAIVFQTDKEGHQTSTPRKTAVARYIKLGKVHDGLIAIEPEDNSWTLDEDTNIVVRGMQRVRKGQELAIAKSRVPMNEVGKPQHGRVAETGPAPTKPARPEPAPKAPNENARS